MRSFPDTHRLAVIPADSDRIMMIDEEVRVFQGTSVVV
jgi:hypothetical protein